VIRGILILVTMQILLFAQDKPPAVPTNPASCPAEVANMNPSRESFLNNMATQKCYGSHCQSAHNKFLEVKVKNNADKTIVGMKFVTAYYDATEDLSTIPVQWNLHGKQIKPGETDTANWMNNLRQEEAAIGWVILPHKILYADGSKWTASGTECMYEWWKDKNHPRVNKAPKLDSNDLEGD